MVCTLIYIIYQNCLSSEGQVIDNIVNTLMKLCLHAQKSLFCDYIKAVFLQKKYYKVKGRIS